MFYKDELWIVIHTAWHLQALPSRSYFGLMQIFVDCLSDVGFFFLFFLNFLGFTRNFVDCLSFFNFSKKISAVGFIVGFIVGFNVGLFSFIFFL